MVVPAWLTVLDDVDVCVSGMVCRVMNSKWRTFKTNTLAEDAVVFLWDILYQVRVCGCQPACAAHSVPELRGTGAARPLTFTSRLAIRTAELDLLAKGQRLGSGSC